MKGDHWLMLLAALLITGGEVLLFGVTAARQTPPSGTAVVDTRSGAHSLGR